MFLSYSLFQNLLCDRLLAYLETLKNLQMVGNGMVKAINLSSVLVNAIALLLIYSCIITP